MTKKRSTENKAGPKPDHLIVEGDWRTAMCKAIKKKRPKEGWPKQDKTK